MRSGGGCEGGGRGGLRFAGPEEDAEDDEPDGPEEVAEAVDLRGGGETSQFEVAEEDADGEDDAEEAEPARCDAHLHQRETDEDGPDAGEEVAEVFTQSGSGVLVEGLEDDPDALSGAVGGVGVLID